MSDCTLLSGNNETVQNSIPAEWEYEQKDFPPDFPMDSITETYRDMDIAIIGEGFFRLADTENGELVYTRNGHFSVDSSGCFVLYVEFSNEDRVMNTHNGHFVDACGYYVISVRHPSEDHTIGYLFPFQFTLLTFP